MKVNQDVHSPFVPNLLLGMAGGIQYLKLKCASRNPRKTQEKTLRAILNYGKDTVYGKEHKFSYILEAGDDAELYKRYQECVSPSEYEDFRPYVNRMKAGEADVLFQGRPLLYATTSGATGEPKWIPISQTYLSNIYGKMNKVWLFNFIKNRPKTYDLTSMAHTFLIEPSFEVSMFEIKTAAFLALVFEGEENNIEEGMGLDSYGAEIPEWLFIYAEPALKLAGFMKLGIPVEFHTNSLNSDAELSTFDVGARVYINPVENLDFITFGMIDIGIGDDADGFALRFGAEAVYSF